MHKRDLHPTVPPQHPQRLNKIPLLPHPKSIDQKNNHANPLTHHNLPDGISVIGVEDQWFGVGSGVLHCGRLGGRAHEDIKFVVGREVGGLVVGGRLLLLLVLGGCGWRWPLGEECAA